MERLVQDALDKGATLLAGGKRDGAVMDATLLDHMSPAMRIYGEESFGPAKSVIRVSGVEEAIRVANDTEYGKRLQTGTCHINGPTVQDEAQIPFGGVTGSGYGRFGGKAGIAEFTDLRWISIESEQHYPF